MLPREFYRRLQAHRKRELSRDEADWGRTLMIVNHIRGALKAAPLSLDDLKRKASAADPANAPTAADWAADCARLDAIRQRRNEQAEA